MKSMRKLIEDDLKYLSSMNVKEYILFKKWEKINLKKKWFIENSEKIKQIHRKIWIPKNEDDYNNLNIKIFPVLDKKLDFVWKVLRETISGMNWNSSPGRLLKFLVTHEEITKNPFFDFEEFNYRYLGIISIGGDWHGVGNRNSIIGWTKENRERDRKMNHTSMGTTIVPTQPFGYNYCGGKLISLLTCSNVVEKTWNEKYKEKLVGITTTSLFGKPSQYDGLKYWRSCKSTTGEIVLEPSQYVYEKLNKNLKKRFPDEYPNLYHEDGTLVTQPKSRILSFICKKLDVKLPHNNFPRGVYWCPLYKNTHEFLRNEEELKEKKFDNEVKVLTELWKDKYARKRIKKLDNILKEVLVYDLVDREWEDVKEQYLKEK